MKNLIFTLLGICFYILPLHSQNELRETATGGDFDQNVSHILQHLDLTEVNTDLLLDKSMEILLLDRFDGSMVHDSNLVNLNVYSRAFAMLS